MSDTAPTTQAAARPERSIVVANAGSGKTWTLANRILAWCMDEVRAGRTPAPSRILAVTFTRKAAGEILARILTHAAAASCDTVAGTKARSNFAAVVGTATREQYQAVLGALAHDLHRMQVGTIDGFFHRIASALPDEVGLPGEWTIGEDRDLDTLRAQAAARLLGPGGAAGGDGAAELIALLEEGAPKPSVLRSITGLLGGASVTVLDHYRACLLGPRELPLPQPGVPPQPASAGNAGITRAWGWLERIPQGADLVGERGADSRQTLFDKIGTLGIPTKKEPKRSAAAQAEPLKVWQRAHARLVELAQRGDIRGIAADSAIGLMRITGRFSGRDLPPDWAEMLELLEPHVRHLLIGDLQGRIDGALQVLPAADAVLRELQEDAGLYAFGDLGFGVARAASTPGTRASTAAALERALGCSISDLAIDEAQDTSAEQFAALRPLIERVLGVAAPDASGAVETKQGPGRGRFLLVGDPKQSIYGWRGGTPGLIAEIARRYGGYLERDAPLTRSYRSSPILMDFVNRVFADLVVDLPALVDDNAHLLPLVGATEFATRENLPDGVLQSAFVRAAVEWRFDRHDAADRGRSGWIKAYACGEARSAPKKRGKGETGDDSSTEGAADADGAVDVAAGNGVLRAASRAADGATPAAGGAAVPSPEPSTETSPEPVSVSVRAAAIAAALHRAHPERSIAVLARTNKAVNETIEALRELGVAASDEGKATLLDSPAVAGVVALLQLIDEPADRIAHFLVSRGPLRAASGLAPLEDAPTPGAAHAEAVRFARRMRAEIADRGLASVLREVVRSIARAAAGGGAGEAATAGTAASGEVALSPRDRGRLERVVAIAEDFDAAPVARLDEFIEALAADKADASSADRVRVMTVHKSKGLEFDEVVLHGANESWGETQSGWGVLAVDPTMPPALVAPLANDGVRMWVPELSILERDERRRRLLDDLSSFYVAITRARRGLHLVVDLKQSPSYPTGAKLVERALSRNTPAGGDTVADASDYARRLADACAASQGGHLPRATDAPFWVSRYDGGDGVPSTEDGELVLDATDASAAPDAAGASAADDGAEARARSHSDAPLVEIVARAAGRAKPPSSHDAPSLWAFDPFGDDDIALRGVLVHECFREIESLETLSRAVAEGADATGSGADSLASIVDRAATRTAIEKATPVPGDLRAEVTAMLARIARGAHAAGAIADWLRLAPNDMVRNEFPFLRASPGGGVVSGRIDRLVLHADAAGRVTGATILDYKTGAKGKPRESLERTLVGYRAQMRAYCEAVEELWSLPSGSARAVLLFVDRDEVVEVPAEAAPSAP